VKNKDNLIDYAVSPRIELTGNTQCVVEGLRGITAYSSDKIKVNLGKFSVSFFGDSLFINAFSYEGAIIEGTIVSLEFESNG